MTDGTQQTPMGMRTTIAIIGHCNAGKSSLLNALTDQDVAIVSDYKGTTTDAVTKPYELIGFGPVTFYDTAGLDDTANDLSEQRVKATKNIMKRADAVLVVIGKDGITTEYEHLLSSLAKSGTPFIPVFNFCDERELTKVEKAASMLYDGVCVSAKNKTGIDELKTRLIDLLKQQKEAPALVSDLVSEGDIVMLVVPIDLAAPKGRLILPQVQVLRELLDAKTKVITVKETDVKSMLQDLKTKPSLVITDSQVIKSVAAVVPENIGLTTFSTLFARAKGNFFQQLNGCAYFDKLQDGDTVLIAEGCSHHVTCDDIGRVKLPKWIETYTHKNIKFEFVSGFDFPEDLSSYALVIQCGGCMLNRQEIQRRLMACEQQNIPVTNYGIAISKLQGVVERITAIF